MARNVEIKARIPSVEALLPRALALAGTEPEPIVQDDSFFACAHGRLKLREFADGRGELIAYQRPDVAGPRTSNYRIVPVDDPRALRAALADALGLIGRVRKKRLLLIVGRTRIHLDRVDSLGDFVELEVILGAEDDEAGGLAEARALMQALGIDEAGTLAGAYLDLFAEPPP